MWANHKQHGFTIVELLIVIVVIGILAAITIVAYNGIQGRAQAAAVSSALEQTAKKLALYVVDNSSYPADLATIGITNSNGTSYQYSVNSAVTPQTYCVTATNGTAIYRINTTNNTTPSSGVCDGHLVGGVAAITNLATNPNIETDGTDWAQRWYGSGGGTGVLTRANTAAFSGNFGYRKTWTTGGGGQDIGFQYVVPVVAGKTYNFSAYIRASVVTGHKAFVTWQDISSTNLTNVVGSEVSVPVNTWQRLSVSGTAPANATKVVFVWGPYPATGSPASVAGQTLDFDAVMITEGSTLYNYFDGNSPNWIWNGTANNSTSTGPAL
ncbi:prepilin-type N-terminal cleavage/methylation domain-containing protein [Candidatus Saccharibacteria bacterium]|nr:prepilin-type N-terminal cleavage/methylation domain-containing protein [Candidatus Saccharibacteria bacterium]